MTNFLNNYFLIFQIKVSNFQKLTFLLKYDNKRNSRENKPSMYKTDIKHYYNTWQRTHKWIRWKSNTSKITSIKMGSKMKKTSTSPSGIHLGHYNALLVPHRIEYKENTKDPAEYIWKTI